MARPPEADKHGAGTAAGGAGGAPEADSRHFAGPRPVGALVPRITRPAFRRRAPAAAQLMADWEAIVGPALAAQTQPRRLAAGTLTIGCAGPVALELGHLATELAGRINAHLGAAVVQRLRFVQDLVAMPPPPPPAPPPEVAALADAKLVPIAAGPLRDALAALGRAVLSEASRGAAHAGTALSTPGQRTR
jgi:hypothetical protein